MLASNQWHVIQKQNPCLNKDHRTHSAGSAPFNHITDNNGLCLCNCDITEGEIGKRVDGQILQEENLALCVGVIVSWNMEHMHAGFIVPAGMYSDRTSARNKFSSESEHCTQRLPGGCYGRLAAREGRGKRALYATAAWWLLWRVSC
jgi:hypothetical protein